MNEKARGTEPKRAFVIKEKKKNNFRAEFIMLTNIYTYINGRKNSYDGSLIFLNVKSNFYFLFLLVTVL